MAYHNCAAARRAAAASPRRSLSYSTYATAERPSVLVRVAHVAPAVRLEEGKSLQGPVRYWTRRLWITLPHMREGSEV